MRKENTMYTGFYDIPCLTGRKSFTVKQKKELSTMVTSLNHMKLLSVS